MTRMMLVYVSGLVFGGGLLLSGMTRPVKVVAFLNVLGDWDPSLAFVMVGGIGVYALAYRLVPRLQEPLLGGRWSLPTRQDIDGRLVLGAALFGAGWGLAGVCPGPALTSLPVAGPSIWVFVIAMFAGMGLFQLLERRGGAR